MNGLNAHTESGRRKKKENGMDAAIGLTVWLPLLTGILTAVATVYGLHRTWQDRRREQRARLADAARVAVRIAEAAYVRPLLRERLTAAVYAFLGERPRGNDDRHHHHPTTARLLLFCRLQAAVGLNPEEKVTARTRAYNELVELLRGMPHPPVSVSGDGALKRARPRLFRAIEVAYNLTPRPSAALIAELGAFAGRIGTLNHATVE